MLLCQVVDVENDQVRIRVINSEMELAVGAHFDEVLGHVVDSELTYFEPAPVPEADLKPPVAFE